MSSNYYQWNDTSVSHTFIRLITKINHPFNHNKLTLEEFQNDYNQLKGYIEWHKNNHIENYINTYTSYNFTQNNMNELFNKIDYNIDNQYFLLNFWNEK